MIRNTLAWLIVLLSLSACQGNKSYDQRMHQADSLMEQRALLASQAEKPLLAASKILDRLRHDSASFTQRQLMRYQLLRVKLHNKQNLSLAHDTIMTTVADYYRRHGSPNEQVEALYLMGRVYHDQGRLPQAIDLYQQADQAADTTRSDCNFWHLFLVHSQLSEIYAEQCLPDRNCEELEKMKRFAANWSKWKSMLGEHEIRYMLSFLCSGERVPIGISGSMTKLLKLLRRVENCSWIMAMRRLPTVVQAPLFGIF